jgi:hypothetical protein
MTGAPLQDSANLQLHDILSLQSFGALCRLKFNAVAFIQRLEAAGLNGGVMNKNVIPGITADKTITFFVVKPLNCTLFFHLFS